MRAVSLSRRYPVESAMGFRISGWVEAIREVNLSIGPGEKVGLAGESGSGKSTLARLIAGLEEPSSGELLWRTQAGGTERERSVKTISSLERAGLCQIVFQDPGAALNPRLSIGTHLEEALRQRRILDSLSGNKEGREPSRTPEREVADLLETAGLPPETAAGFPHQLSGGQKQRVNIARAAAMRPRLLIGDEPVSALDVSVQAQILELLLSIQRRLGMAILWISHDLSLLGAVTKRLYVMKEGRIVEEGPTDRILRQPRESYTRLLVEATPMLS